MHFMLTIADVCFTALGTLLDYHVGNSCYVRNHVHTAIVVVIVGNYFIIACNFLGVALIFSVFAHLPSEERWNRMFGILGCCLCMPVGSDRERDNQGTLSQIATCFGEVFQGADLVPRRHRRRPRAAGAAAQGYAGGRADRLERDGGRGAREPREPGRERTNGVTNPPGLARRRHRASSGRRGVGTSRDGRDTRPRRRG